MRLNLQNTFLALILTSSCLQASIRPEPGEYAIQFDYLYLNPLYEQDYFVAESSGISLVNVLGERYDNPFDWDSAYRVQGIYTLCDGLNDFRLGWTYLNTSTKRSVSSGPGTFLVDLFTPAPFSPAFLGTETSNIHLKYYSIDALFSHMFYDGSPLELAVQGGLNYSYLKLNQRVNAFGTVFTTEANKNNRVGGIGPEVGIDGRYKVPVCFLGCFGDLPLSFFGNFKTALLISESKSTINSSNSIDGTFLDIDSTNKWRAVPMFDFRFGLGLNWCFSCWSSSLEIGYEFLSYVRAIQTQNFTSSISDSLPDYYDSLSFQGPYISLGVSF